MPGMQASDYLISAVFVLIVVRQPRAAAFDRRRVAGVLPIS
jgi:hypothetical protein